ncbi:MAG: hypothetical protein LIV11_02505 [Bacillota bacterium]|nr:hypothetical protein [Bacillota bacterium]
MEKGFRNIIDIDEQRMKGDGLDATSLWDEIDTIVSDTIGFIVKEDRHTYLFHSSGARDWMLYKLKQNPVFLKYVCEWVNHDPFVIDNLILQNNRMGLKCNYG